MATPYKIFPNERGVRRFWQKFYEDLGQMENRSMSQAMLVAMDDMSRIAQDEGHTLAGWPAYVRPFVVFSRM